MDPYVHMLISRAESSAQSQAARIQRATSLRDVAQNRRADISSMIAALARSLPAVRRLAQVADDKAEQLVTEQLAELERLTADAFETRVSFLREREWVHLRGNFPSLVSKVDNAVIRMRQRRATS